jgi:hypothetical protein
MRGRQLIGLLLVLAAGCSGKTRPTEAGNTNVPIGSGLPPPVQPQRPVVAPKPTYQGQTAQQWSLRLKDRDLYKRQQANEALGELGEEGYPYLLQGLRSGDADQRLSSLKALRSPVLTAHREETMPLLLEMLRDPDPLIRQSAAVRLSWYGKHAQPALGALEVLAKNDVDPDVRRMAERSAVHIREALSGKLPSGG